MTGPLRVLLVEDSSTDAKLIVHELRRSGRIVEFDRVDDADGLRDALASRRWHVVLTDSCLPSFGAIEALAIVRELADDVPVIIVSGTIGDERAVELVRAGAHDYVSKDDLRHLLPAVARALHDEELRSARQRAEAELKASEGRYRRIVETMHESMIVLDARGRVTFVNERAATLLGFRSDEMLGHTLSERIGVPDATREAHLAKPRAGASDAYELSVTRKDGETLLVHVNARPILDADGAFDGALWMVADLTERKQLRGALEKSEEQLRQLQKMEAIGSLAAGIAHDFNNILSVILTLSGLMLSDLDGADPHREDAVGIQEAAERAAMLTRQLLLFSRHEAPEARELDLNEIVVGVEAMLRRIVGEDVALTLSVASTPALVRGNVGHLEQVVMNLAVNARDAMPAGGALSIETARLELDEAFAAEHVGIRPGPHVALVVSDTGGGMDEATQARIFEPFFTTKTRGRGVGLGLSTVFGIVRQSGGSIWVKSAPGRGTTFTIYFPSVAGGGVTDGPQRAAPTTLRGTETILLVDDDDGTRKAAREILRRQGYSVLEARDATHALELSASHPRVDLLLTDVVMPGASGPELARRLTHERPSLRVLYMSGYSDEATARYGGASPRMTFLQKPVTPDALARKVREVLDAAEVERAPGT